MKFNIVRVIQSNLISKIMIFHLHFMHVHATIIVSKGIPVISLVCLVYESVSQPNKATNDYIVAQMICRFIKVVRKPKVEKNS